MDKIKDYWYEYQRALLPKTAPHLPPRIELLSTKYLVDNKLIFARWISDFDCQKETEWYFVLKDDCLKIDKLKAKLRYEINKGHKNFSTEVINPIKYFDDIFYVSVEAYSVYPEKYRPHLVKDTYKQQIKKMIEDGYVFIGEFDRDKGNMVGFAVLECGSESINYRMHKVLPAQEKRAVNAALVSGVLAYYEAGNYKYIVDGERAIKHQTGFQNYLIKYFGFRKAYCKLNILYNPLFRVVVNLLYPFRVLLGKFKNSGLLYNVYCVLEQERIRRTFL